MTVSPLTPKRVTTAKPKHRHYTIWDRRVKGFGLRVAPSGRKSFVVNTTRNGSRYIETIGDASAIPLKEARNDAREIVCVMDAMQALGPNTPFEVVAEVVMRRMERVWKPRTMEVRRSYLRTTILPFFKGRAISSISRSDVAEWFAELHHKPAAANYCIPFLSVIMREAEEAGVRKEDSNPVSGLRRYRVRKRNRVLNPEEMARLGRALEHASEREPLRVAIIRLMALTGCRRGELIDLEWRDYRNGHLYLRDSKTGPKTVFLSPQAREILDGVRSPRPGPVFPPPRKNRRGISLNHLWKRLQQETGLEGVRLHDLRHGYASIAVRNGVNLSVVGLLLGHTNPQTTIGYAHFNDSTMQDAVELVCGCMATKGNGDAI